MNKVTSTSGKNILLVDDDQTVRESIKLLLSIDRHHVTEAENGHEALQLYTGSTYDLVITDYLMPSMLGDELARNIKNLTPGQPVLIVTAYVEKLVDAGKPADAVLGKPLGVDELRQAMRKWLEGAAGENANAASIRFAQPDAGDRASTITTVLHDILRRN